MQSGGRFLGRQSLFLGVLCLVSLSLLYLGSLALSYEGLATPLAKTEAPTERKASTVQREDILGRPPFFLKPPSPIYDSSAEDDEQEMDIEALKARYTLKHNRPPPPRFEEWFQFAKENKCYLDRYDAIYRDLAPFLGMSVEEFKSRMGLALRAPSVDRIVIRNGVPEIQYYDNPFFQYIRKTMTRWITRSSVAHPSIDPIAKYLPDMVIPMNLLDEPRILFQPGPDRVSNLSLTKHLFYTPPRGSHFDYLKARCLIYSKEHPFVSLQEKHGFPIEPDSSSYSRYLLPMLSQTKLDPCFSDILFPTPYYFQGASKGAAGRKIPWNRKASKLYWRGSTTGGHALKQNYKFFQRHRLMSFRERNASLFDVAFTATIQCGWFDCRRMRKEYPFVGRADFTDNFENKFLLDIDGNSFSGRYVAFLYSGSLVFKSTLFSEYFRDWLKPYVHYIPVEVDLSDLQSKVQWALNHDDEARQIALNSQRFAERHLTSGQMNCYTYLLLLEIARLMGIVTPSKDDSFAEKRNGTVNEH